MWGAGFGQADAGGLVGADPVMPAAGQTLSLIHISYELYGEKLTIYRTMGKKTTALLTLPVSAITGIGAKAKVNGRGQYFCYEKGNGFHLSYRAERGEGWFYFQPDARMVKMLQDVRAGRKTPDADVEDD